MQDYSLLPEQAGCWALCSSNREELCWVQQSTSKTRWPWVRGLRHQPGPCRSCLLSLPGCKARHTWKGLRSSAKGADWKVQSPCLWLQLFCLHTHGTGCLLPCSVFAAIEKLPCNGLGDIRHLHSSVLSQGCHRNEPYPVLCAEMTNVTCLAPCRLPRDQVLLWCQVGFQKNTGRVQELSPWPNAPSPGNHRATPQASQHKGEICSYSSFSLLCMILHLIYTCCRPHHMFHPRKWSSI